MRTYLIIVKLDIVFISHKWTKNEGNELFTVTGNEGDASAHRSTVPLSIILDSSVY